MQGVLRRIGAIAIAALVAFAITAIGQTLWGVMAIANVKLSPAVPWAALAMPIVLAVLVAFLAGAIGPRQSAAARRALLPLAPVTARAWFWSLAAGGAAVVAAAALWTVLASLVRVAPNVLPDIHGVPALTVIALLAASIVAAPLTEEIAFRGYAMGLLRRRFSPIAALVITSLLFASAHLTQGLSAPKLAVYLLAGLAFGFVALRTGSLAPAMVVHGFADLTFFTLVWSHDAGRKLVSEGGADGWFFANVAILLVMTPLSLLAFRALTRATSAAPLAGAPPLFAVTA